MPNALLEALMAGRPVVSTDVGAVPDILGIAGGDVGSMVPRGDAAALARAIRFELERQPAPGAEAGRALVRERFSLSHRVAALRSMYEEVLSRP
jgi:glycosyltransferase involved in cell wall biosynthesis